MRSECSGAVVVRLNELNFTQTPFGSPDTLYVLFCGFPTDTPSIRQPASVSLLTHASFRRAPRVDSVRIIRPRTQRL